MAISIKQGKIDGIMADGVEQFLGIPYAAPPVGALRFRPPQPPAAWDGIRECKRYGSAAPQLYVEGLTSFRGEGETPLNEDCLYLNVTTPKADDEKRPVLFWIHGGAFQKGSATMGIYEPSFAKEGLVVVNCNYRVGVLGFMDLSEYLGKEYSQSGNTGMLDIVQALKWTKENIASFGGDPENITIMGQSAGAKIVGFLTVMKPAKGLFNKAIMLSGSVQCLRDPATARKVTDMFMKDAGLTKETAAELLDMPWDQIVDKQKKLFAGLNLHTVGAEFDGINFEGRNALDIISDQTANNVPTLVGTNRDELDLYWHVYKFHELDDFMAERLFGSYGPIVKADMDEQLAGLDKDSSEYHRKFVSLTTEYIYRAGCNQMAVACADAGQPVYMFRNDWEQNGASGTPFLACHGSETQFIFGPASVIKKITDTPEHAKQAQQMHDSCINFIKHGKPSAEGMPEWPEFNSSTRLMMVFDGEGHVERSPLPDISPEMPHQVFWLK